MGAMARKTRREARLQRHRRVRKKIMGTPDRPRLCVFKSHRYTYAQLIDDLRGHTLAAASDLEPDLRQERRGKKKVEMAALVGARLAQRALALGISRVVFDRGGYKYHGRVKALAEAARKEGLIF